MSEIIGCFNCEHDVVKLKMNNVRTLLSKEPLCHADRPAATRKLLVVGLIFDIFFNQKYY